MPQAFCPAFLNRLFDASDGKGPGGDIFRDNTAGADISAIANLNGRDKGRISTDESALADIGAILGDAVIIASNGARADVSAFADTSVTDISKMVGLGAGLDLSRFHLDEIAYVHVFAKIRAWPQPRKRADTSTLSDMCAFQI